MDGEMLIMCIFDLMAQINPDDWHMRARTVRDMAFRYYKPLFERIWLIVASLCVFLPIHNYLPSH